MEILPCSGCTRVATGLIVELLAEIAPTCTNPVAAFSHRVGSAWYACSVSLFSRSRSVSYSDVACARAASAAVRASAAACVCRSVKYARRAVS